MSSNQKQKQEKTDTTFWDERRRITRSHEDDHGYSVMDDLVGKKSYFQVLVLNAAGRMPERRLADWIEAAFNCFSCRDSPGYGTTRSAALQEPCTPHP